MIFSAFIFTFTRLLEHNKNIKLCDFELLKVLIKKKNDWKQHVAALQLRGYVILLHCK